MSDKIFIDIVNMSLVGSFAIIITMIARLCLKKAPKIFSYALWAVAFSRLIIPFSFESFFSILPFNATPLSTDMLYIETPYVETGVKAIDNVLNPIVSSAVLDNTFNVYQATIFVGKVIWYSGVLILLIYSIVSYIRIKRVLDSSVHLRDNIFISEKIKIPFVAGFFNANIYLPKNFDNTQEYIILHEQTHIRRRDNILKIFAYAVLALHWFNPLVWIAFRLFVADMEMSCDESVIRKANTDIRKEYSQSLLNLSIQKQTVGTPIAFSEGNPKERIKNIMNIKKTIGIVGVVSVILIAVIAICLIPNRPQFSTVSEVITNVPTIRNSNVSSAKIKTEDGDIDVTDSDNLDHLLTFVESLEINKKEISRDRSEDRDSTNTITFFRQDNTFDSSVNFNQDYSEMWISTNGTSSFTYKVKIPNEVKEQILEFISN
ncbi:MAG: hypothetical protein KH365_04090 [Clostridiales bacterium]|jgi:beta-lactamase regulating signal transducer with metallopeptidase domain|nr:hypothetical protein [Clostridiales bacterium]